MELVSSGVYGNEHYYIYEKTTIDEVGQRLNSFFEGERYRLEKEQVRMVFMGPETHS